MSFEDYVKGIFSGYINAWKHAELWERVFYIGIIMVAIGMICLSISAFMPYNLIFLFFALMIWASSFILIILSLFLLRPYLLWKQKQPEKSKSDSPSRRDS